MQTVFIIGAGASMPYGFPSGQGLTEDVIRLCAGSKEQVFDDNKEAQLAVQFTDLIRETGALSVDRLLEHQSDFVEVGKRLMAAVIINRERSSTSLIHKLRWKRNALPKDAAPFDDWYRWLVDQLRSHDFETHPIHFVTFNYDRSFEQFVCRPMAAWGADEQARRINEAIIHVHGAIQASIEYGVNLTPAICRRAAESIVVIHEADAHAKSMVRAREVIAAADRIAFLGLSYDPVNLRRLGFPEGCMRTGSNGFRRFCGVAGTAFELEAEERRRAGICLWGEPDPATERLAKLMDVTCLKFLRTHFGGITPLRVR